MFCAGLDDYVVDSESNTVTLYKTDDIYTTKGWISASEICVGEVLLTDDNLTATVEDIKFQDDRYIIYFTQQ